MDKKDKVALINKEIETFRELYEDLPAAKREAVYSLIDEVAFMYATLKECKDKINENEHGPLDWFRQGDNAYFREHPATKTYNTMINRYASLCKQLFDIAPDAPPKKDKEDEVINFITKKKSF